MMPTAVFAADDSADSNPPTVYEGTEGGALETEQEGDRYLPDSEQPDPTLPGLQAEPTAEADADNWLNEADTSWYDSGEKNFEIDTAAELAGLAKLVNGGETFAGKIVKLTGKIDLLGKEWTPIGTKDAAFQGSFDGGGNSITGMTIDSASDHVGLFGITKGGTLEQIKLENASIVSTRSGDAYVGAITGEGYTGTIQNCSVTGLKLSAKGNFVGGISGQGYAKINGCTWMMQRSKVLVGRLAA